MSRLTYLAVRNWDRFQHYKDGRPLVWIKFYVSMLDDHELRALPPPVRLLFDQYLLLAAKTNNCIPNDTEWVTAMTSLDHETTQNGTRMLVKGAWLRHFRSRRALEQSREEKRREETPLTPLHKPAVDNALLLAAVNLAASWNGHDSDTFAGELDRLEREHEGRLTYIDRERLWRQAFQ